MAEPAKGPEYDLIEPIGKRVVVRKDDSKRETRSEIVLPDNHEIPVIAVRVIATSKQIENDGDLLIRQYDRVLFDPPKAIPVELEHDNGLYVLLWIMCWRSFVSRGRLMPPGEHPPSP